MANGGVATANVAQDVDLDDPHPSRGIRFSEYALRRVAGFLVIVLAGFLAGCTSSPPQTFPVRGKVFYSGKPAAGAVVFFHLVIDKVNAESPAAERLPTGIVQSDGTFELSTFGVKDGAPAGRYRVSIIWTKATGESDEATNLLPAKYMNPVTAGLPIIEVREEAMELAPFKLAPSVGNE